MCRSDRETAGTSHTQGGPRDDHDGADGEREGGAGDGQSSHGGDCHGWLARGAPAAIGTQHTWQRARNGESSAASRSPEEAAEIGDRIAGGREYDAVGQSVDRFSFVDSADGEAAATKI